MSGHSLPSLSIILSRTHGLLVLPPWTAACFSGSFPGSSGHIPGPPVLLFHTLTFGESFKPLLLLTLGAPTSQCLVYIHRDLKFLLTQTRHMISLHLFFLPFPPGDGSIQVVRQKLESHPGFLNNLHVQLGSESYCPSQTCPSPGSNSDSYLFSPGSPQEHPKGLVPPPCHVTEARALPGFLAAVSQIIRFSCPL